MPFGAATGTYSTLCGVTQDGLSHGMREALLGTGSDLDNLLHTYLWRHSSDVNHRWIPLSDGAGLIENDGIDSSQLLQSPTAADEHTSMRSACDSRKHGGRDRDSDAGGKVGDEDGRSSCRITRQDQNGSGQKE